MPATTLWAVHISDGILRPAWVQGGFVVAALLILLAVWRLRDEDIPRIALLASAFFVGSLMHLPVGPTSLHLLLNGLVGVLLRRQAALAIALGLTLQALLLGHGGFTTLGINTCILTVPALLAGYLFPSQRRAAWLHHPACRVLLVALSSLIWMLSLVFALALLLHNSRDATVLDVTPAWQWALHPLTLALGVVVAFLAACCEQRLERAPDFPLGLLLGELTVILTLALNAAALLLGGEADWQALVLVLFVAHLPLAVLEGLALGFLISFLARVKPELLGWDAPAPPESSRPEVVPVSPGRSAESAPCAAEHTSPER